MEEEHFQTLYWCSIAGEPAICGGITLEQRCDIGFVILHYKAIETTISSINSLMEHCDTENYAIVVVDNGSPDGSGAALKEKYVSNYKVHVIKLERNLGFSAGNNVGYRYAKGQLRCDYIVLMNNDIYLMSDNLYLTVKANFEKYNYSVLGPRLYGKTKEGREGKINPVPNQRYSIKRLKVERIDCKLYLTLSKVHLESLWFFFRFGVIRWVKEFLEKNMNESKDISYYETQQFHVALQGCIWIFSPEYVRVSDGLPEITFMYHEEEILWNQIKDLKGLMMYEPQISAFHDHESSSTRSVAKTLRKSKIEKYKKMLKSTEDLLQYYMR